MIVAQARAAPFYRNYGVPDTVNGRFEMVVLHTVLVLRRLESEPVAVRALGQALFDRFCGDMDGSLRELGIGDLAVPAKMRKIGEAFYGRQSAYSAALDDPDPAALIGALARNVFGAPTGTELGAIRLARYVRAVAGRLAEQDGQALSRAELTFPDPQSLPVEGPMGAPP
ncbi:MAG TPA: ubiquinol-cytochrome C chaperone family protein [Xanthobacteraceae bacterium]|jgi:cytochrome b pre-mRNA-processing protein 3